MPYISVNVSSTLKEDDKERLKAKLGETIAVIPGKTEAVTMVSITDSCALYMGGRPLVKGAFIETRIYGTAEKTHKENYVKALFAAMEDVLGYPKEDIYINFLELESWGLNGRMV